MTMKQNECDLYASIKNTKYNKADLRLNEELNITFILKQISRDKETINFTHTNNLGPISNTQINVGGEKGSVQSERGGS